MSLDILIKTDNEIIFDVDSDYDFAMSVYKEKDIDNKIKMLCKKYGNLKKIIKKYNKSELKVVVI